MRKPLRRKKKKKSPKQIYQYQPQQNSIMTNLKGGNQKNDVSSTGLTVNSILSTPP